MSVTKFMSSAPSLSVFSEAAKQYKFVALDKSGLQVQQAKQGFFARFLQWFRGESFTRINGETKALFIGAMAKAYGGKIANKALYAANFDLSLDKPLTSRDIKVVVEKAEQKIDIDRRDSLHKLSRGNVKSEDLEGIASRQIFKANEANAKLYGEGVTVIDEFGIVERSEGFPLATDVMATWREESRVEKSVVHAGVKKLRPSTAEGEISEKRALENARRADAMQAAENAEKDRYHASKDRFNAQMLAQRKSGLPLANMKSPLGGISEE